MLQHVLNALARTPPVQVADDGRPQSAVALLLAADPDRVLLIRRAERAGDPWSGQLALPGGRRQAGDTDLLATAIRETAEEIGIQLESGWCRAQLDDLAPRTPTLPQVVVRPFVFLLFQAVTPVPNEEVAEASWIPLADLVADGVYGQHSVRLKGEMVIVNGYQLRHGLLWGMTERILGPVVTAWKKLS